MPDYRKLHNSAGHSQKLSMLTDFEYRVWIQYRASADDFGVCPFTTAKLQGDNRRLAEVPASRVRSAIERLIDVGLVTQFMHQGQAYLCQLDWQEFEDIRYPRASAHPVPPPDVMQECTEQTRVLFQTRTPRTKADPRGRERSLRDLFAAVLPRALCVETLQVKTEVRLGNSYADIVADLSDGSVLVGEVKRHPLTAAAISQVRRYQASLKESRGCLVHAFVIARSVPPEIQIPTDVGVVTIGASMECRAVAQPVALFRDAFLLIDTGNNVVGPTHAGAGTRETQTLTQTQTLTPLGESAREGIAAPNVWTRVVEALPIANQQQLAEWFGRCVLLREYPDRIVVGVPTEVHLEWLPRHYSQIVAETLAVVAPGKHADYELLSARRAS